MSRIIVDQRNTWGSQGNTDNPQRADLWVLDLRSVVDGLNNQIKANPGFEMELIPSLPMYFAQSVTPPELKIAAEVFNRDSNPFWMPVQDEPLCHTRVVFYMDAPVARRSKIYSLLDTWRTFVRAGRTTFGTENGIPLDRNYSVTMAFNISLLLLRGASAPVVSYATATASSNGQPGDFRGVENDLEVCGQYELQKAWLSSFKIGELSYANGNTLSTIEATIYQDYFIDKTVSLARNASVYTP